MYMYVQCSTLTFFYFKFQCLRNTRPLLSMVMLIYPGFTSNIPKFIQDLHQIFPNKPEPDEIFLKTLSRSYKYIPMGQDQITDFFKIEI